jgi:uncharacterized protein with PIN domain
MDHWLLYNEFGDHRKRISRAARRSARRDREISRRVDDLEQQLDRLSLVTQSLWELVKRDRGLDDEALATMVKEIDLSDGKIDGKAPQTVSVCTACERIMSPDHERCLYCGAERLERAPFEGL